MQCTLEKNKLTRANWPFPVVNGKPLPQLPKTPVYPTNGEPAPW